MHTGIKTIFMAFVFSDLKNKIKGVKKNKN
jgi:hypothetical protein